MRLTGTHRPIAGPDENPGEPVPIEAEGVDFAEAREKLHALVPEGHQLMHIVTGVRG